MNGESISVRAYQSHQDWPVIQHWLIERDMGVVDTRALPALGRVAELANGDDAGTLVAAAWVYADPSCNLAFLHNLIARPGNSVAIFRRALRALVDSLSREAARRGYHHLSTHTRTGGLLRECEKLGFQVSDARPHQNIYKPLIY